MTGNDRNRKILCFGLIILNLLFIWGNSALPGKLSGGISNGILVWVNSHAGTHLTGHMIRKLAHFSEFTALGMLLSWLGLLLVQKSYHQVTVPLLFGILAACLDETIQVFVPNRGPSVLDVWIDTAGVLFGIGILLLGHAVLKRRKQQNNGGTIR